MSVTLNPVQSMNPNHKFWSLYTVSQDICTCYPDFLIKRVYFQIFWAIGACFEVLLALAVMPTLGWRWLLGLSAVPLLIFSCCCFVSSHKKILSNLKYVNHFLFLIFVLLNSNHIKCHLVHSKNPGLRQALISCEVTWSR